MKLHDMELKFGKRIVLTLIDGEVLTGTLLERVERSLIVKVGRQEYSVALRHVEGVEQ